jgi:hypothetical protein
LSGTGDDRVLFPVRPSEESSAEDAAAQGVAQEVVEDNEAGAEDEEEEQALQARPLRDPRAPTAAERAAHEATHLPFRSWCEVCVAGRRDNPAHRGIKVEEDELAVPEVGMDYCFVRREEEEDVVTVLVLKDRISRAIRAIRVMHKGAESESEVVRVVECIRSFGHRCKIALKSDGEPAILALKAAISRHLPEGVIAVESAATESESNGSIENGVKLLKGMVRVHLLALERKVGGRFPSAHPCIAWLVEHTSDVVTKYLQGSDGRTAFERLFGKRVHEEALEFGERVQWRKRRAQDSNVVLDARWADGIWLGRKWGTCHHRISVGREVFEVRAVQRRPTAERWNLQLLEGVLALPWKNPAPEEGEEAMRVLPPLEGTAAAPPRVRDEPAPKRVYIRNTDLERWGYTSNCHRCNLMREGRSAAGKAHTEACRARIEEAMRGEEDSRVLAADGRRALTRAVEAGGPSAGAAVSTEWEALLGPDGELVELRPYEGGDVEVTGIRQRPTPSVQHGGSSSSGLHRPEGGPSAAPRVIQCRPESGPAPDHPTTTLPRAEEERGEPQPRTDDAWRALARRLQRQQEVRVEEEDVHMERDPTIELLCPEAEGAEALYELMLTMGADPSHSRAKVAELYSPPRVTAHIGSLPHVHLEAGMTFDLREGRDGKRWNFLQAADRAKARQLISKEKPFIVIGSPPCTDFSSWNTRLNHKRMSEEEVRRRKAEAETLLGFAIEVYEHQIRHGRHFLHEHPASATSWSLPKMMGLRKKKGVGEVVGHLCQYGLTAKAGGHQTPALKPTRFLSSAEEVLKLLGKKCTRDHEHQRLAQGRARDAAIYPPELCKAMLRGIEAQLRREGRAICDTLRRDLDRGCAVYSLSRETECEGHDMTEEVTPEEEYMKVRDEHENMQKYGSQRYWDAITNEELPASLTAEARAEELAFMNEWKVWDVVPLAECWKKTGKKPLQSKWVDVNKGDLKRPVVRSRFVAKEFATTRSDEFFAATPPLEALRMLLSHAATGRKTSKGGRKVLVIDARKAHLHAPAERLVYVDLPPEVKQPGMCARLRRCLYGTRDAPARWEAFLAGELEKMGFEKGKASPCCFRHISRDLRCIVHGDDFVFVGAEPDLEWAQQEMNSRFLIKVIGRLGGDSSDLQELRVLNRVLRWSPDGIYAEADPRHQEILVAQLTGDLKSLTTPGTKGKAEKEEEEEEGSAEEELTAQEVSAYRSGAARANYLSLDRPDIAYATKELCRRMSCPTRKDLEPLVRVARYLKGAPRVAYRFAWQPECGLQTFVDTDFAGCLVTRRSTSGGCAMRGTHLIKHWSVTQKAVTLSSGEAELCGIVKGTAEALGIQSLGRDLGVEMCVSIHTDSSAAAGICRRSGIGRVRHLAVGQLWVQEGLRRGDFKLFKIPGTENPADLLTKHLAREAVDAHLKRIALERQDGRAQTAPEAQLT